MFAKKIVLKGLVLFACLFLLSTSTALSQDFCNGDFDYDGDVDGWTLLDSKPISEECRMVVTPVHLMGQHQYLRRGRLLV